MEDDCRLLIFPFSLILCLCVVSASLPVLVSLFVCHGTPKRDRRGRLKGVGVCGVSMDNRVACVGEVSSTSPATSIATRKVILLTLLVGGKSVDASSLCNPLF